MKLWDVATGVEVQSFTTLVEARAVEFSPNGQSVMSSGGPEFPLPKLWNISTGQEIGHWEFVDEFMKCDGATSGSSIEVSSLSECEAIAEYAYISYRSDTGFCYSSPECTMVSVLSSWAVYILQGI